MTGTTGSAAHAGGAAAAGPAGGSAAERVGLLALLGTVVLLSGVELMVTAVALPAIVADLASWSRLRDASWVVNGYLVVQVVAMPLAGALADLHGTRRVLTAALGCFTLGSLLAGAAPTLEALVAARLVQAAGGGALVPVATAAAAQAFPGAGRTRAIGVVGALTFLGMAAGPAVGAAILVAVHPEVALARLGIPADSPVAAAVAPAWRWVFHANVPVGLAALVLVRAAPPWPEVRRTGRLDLGGAALVSVALAASVVAISLAGSRPTPAGPDPTLVIALLAAVAAGTAAAALRRLLRVPDPFIDPRRFRNPGLAAAALVALLTGHGLATAIVGAAVFVDRVAYGGPGEQRLALGAIGLGTAAAAAVAGLLLRTVPPRAVSVAGLGAMAAAFAGMAGWTPATALPGAAATLAVLGVGFGLTLTPRTAAAVAAVEASAAGTASSIVTVARTLGMAVGLAVLTAYGSTVIEDRTAALRATPEAYLAFIPAELRDRPLRDLLVVEALEAWAAGEAASVMRGLHLAAALVTLAAVPPALALDRRRRILDPGERRAPPSGGGRGDGPEDDDGSDERSGGVPGRTGGG